MHGKGAGSFIHIKMKSEKEMQFVEFSHLQFIIEVIFQLVDYVHIFCGNDEIAYIYDYKYNVMASLQKNNA